MPAIHSAAVQPATDDRADFAWTVRVYYEDTDAAGIVCYANSPNYFERCRTGWLRSLGFDQRQTAAGGRPQPVVADLSVQRLRRRGCRRRSSGAWPRNPQHRLPERSR